MKRLVIVVLAASLGLAASGCYLPHLFVALFKPKEYKEYKAEYPLEAKRVVVVPYVPTDTQFTYPTAAIEISRAVVNEMIGRLKDHIEEIEHPVSVVQWQESNLDWPNLTMDEIGRLFEADTVVYVELLRYTMFEEGSQNLFRGRAKARVQVVKTDRGPQPVYDTVVDVIFPQDRPAGVLETSERVITNATNILLAEQIVNRFRDRKVEIRGGEEVGEVAR